jgi:hypothetical protein
MRARTVTWLSATACLLVFWAARCDAQVTLAWNPSTGPGVTGYNLCWGTNSGVYIYTNSCAAAQTSVTVSNLQPNTVYFFVVEAVAADGSVSLFSNEQIYTNGPPSPPATGSTNVVGGTNSDGSNSNSPAPPSPTLAQSNTWGIPPCLTLVASNGQASLTLGGTVGATLTVMGTTNDLTMDLWSAVTNVTVSNLAPASDSSATNQPLDMLGVAFVPGTETLALGAPMSAGFQYFQVVMPYDYIILASQVLPGKGYTPRLIVINMPGIVADDACYIAQTGSFIHCTRTNYVLQLISSSSTIRQIATSLANSLSVDWTSASEFTFSNGLSQILATVIETEPASSDPVAGQNPPGPPIVIDF